MAREIKVSASYLTKKYEMNEKKSQKLRSSAKKKQKKSKDFWALRGVSFDVFAGESVGLIGTNGSGKSTLSNIIAGVSTPTTGKITINGTTSIVAIKSGLKKELTGRENVRLKCLLSGMSNAETDAIIDDIIAFSDLDDFIDQPLKSYSSGMKSRLGFAISVHQEPDILIIDEALSVGDDTFYQRCVDKIYDFKAQGKTISFVSHSLKQIKNLCDRVIWVHDGEMKQIGETKDVIESYQNYVEWYKGLPKEEQRQHKKTQKKERQKFKINDYYQETLSLEPEKSETELKSLFYPAVITEKTSISNKLLVAMMVIAMVLITIHYMSQM